MYFLFAPEPTNHKAKTTKIIQNKQLEKLFKRKKTSYMLI